MRALVFICLLLFSGACHAERTATRIMYMCDKHDFTQDVQVVYRENGTNYTFTQSGKRYIQYTDADGIFYHVTLGETLLSGTFSQAMKMRTGGKVWHTALGKSRRYPGIVDSGVLFSQTVEFTARMAGSREYTVTNYWPDGLTLTTIETIDDDDMTISAFVEHSDRSVVETAPVCTRDILRYILAIGEMLRYDAYTPLATNMLLDESIDE